MRALCLAGGGARGAFQVGVALAMEELGLKFDAGYGVSAGALNISHILAGQAQDLAAIWRNVREKDVHHTFGALRIAWRIGVQRKRGLYDNTPLRGLIERTITPHPAARVGFVRLSDGAYFLEPASHESIYASATMPIIWEPVGGDMIDGGVRNQTPLSDAVQAGAEQIVCVLCRPAGLRNVHYEAGGHIPFIEDALRTIEIMSDEIAEGDIRITRMRNEQVEDRCDRRSAQGRPYRWIDLTVIRPERWIGDTLSFEQKEIEENMEHGYEVGMKVLGG